MDDINLQMKRTKYKLTRLLNLYGISKSKYYSWRNAKSSSHLPPLNQNRRNNILSILPYEEQKVICFRKDHKDIGYRKLTYMMIDQNIVYLSESMTYKALSRHNMLYGWHKSESNTASKEYENKPKHVHDHWHTDIAYIKIRGIFYYLIMLLDGYSRFLLGWELMVDMLSDSAQDFIQKIKEKYPFAKPNLINDNGTQFVSLDFKSLLRRLNIQQICARPYHPETNGKIERMNKTVKNEAIRLNYPRSYKEAWDILNEYQYFYNHQRLHAGIGYLRPADKFFGRDQELIRERKKKTRNARKNRIIQNRRRMTHV